MFDALLGYLLNKKKTYFNWSSGKDAAMALYHLQEEGGFQVNKLITTVNSHYKRVSMHGLRKELLERQALETGIPLSIIELPEQPTMEVYNEIMRQTLTGLCSEGYTHSAFGDIFLEDLKAYREQQLASFGVTGIFPLWKRNTKELIHEFLQLGFKAVVICVKSDLLDETFVGRDIDASFLEDLPDTVDPCGENGEFHTFCYDGPIFKNPVAFQKGEKIFREYKAPKEEGSHKKTVGFWFLDLIPNP